MGRRKQEEEEKKDGFMVLFTALSMILVAFFILLNAISQIDETRTRAVIDSLVGTFGPLPGFSQARDNAGMNYIQQQISAADLSSLIEAIVTERQLTVNISSEIDQEGRLVIKMDNDLAFDLGETHISPRVFEFLDELAILLEQAAYQIHIEGHSDSVSPQGTLSNWYISSARAASVYQYLANQQPNLEPLLRAYGFADSQPNPNGDDRRVVIIVVPDTGS